MKAVWGIFVAALGCPLVTMAQPATDFNRWELGGEFGTAEHALSHSSEDNKVDEQDAAYRVFATYYFTPQVAIRVGYADLGEVDWYKDAYYDDYTNTRVNELSARSSADTLTVGGVFTLPINASPVTFGVEIGFLNWTVDYATVDSRTPDGGNTVVESATYSSSDIGFYGGASVSYQMMPQMAVGLGVLWYAMTPEINGDDGFDLVVQNLNLSAVFRF